MKNFNQKIYEKFKRKYIQKSIDYIYNDLQLAFEDGSIQLVEFLLEYIPLRISASVVNEEPERMLSHLKKFMNEGFEIACSKNYLEVIKLIIENEEYQNLLDAKNLGFQKACERNNKKIIEYLLGTDFIINRMSTLYLQRGLKQTCRLGRLEVLKLLTKSEMFMNKMTIHFENDICFISALENQHTKVIEYLIQDFKMKRSPSINNCLDKVPLAFVENIKNLFEKQEFVDKLEMSLLGKNKTAYKIKI